MAFKLLPDQSTLRQLLDYDPESGLLYWRQRGVGWFEDGFHTAETRMRNWNACHAGKRAFTAKQSNGYRRGKVLGAECLAHRVIWVLVHGEQPKIIDHANGNREDNRIGNLRSGSHATNSMNKARLCNNTSGYTGVSKCNATGRWRVMLVVSGRSHRVGRFDTLEQAIEAHRVAATRLGFHQNHGRSP